MSFYEKYILPHAIHFTCKQRLVAPLRQEVVPLAEGVVLELGIGSGLNLPFYDPGRVKVVIGVDPSEALWRKSASLRRGLPFPVEFLPARAEVLPLENHSVDTVLLTFTLCTVQGVGPALEEARRVLRPGGRLVFCEHGLAPEPGVRRWQHRLNPLWKPLAGGCNLNRDIPALLRTHGWDITHLQEGYFVGLKIVGYAYRGVAV